MTTQATTADFYNASLNAAKSAKADKTAITINTAQARTMCKPGDVLTIKVDGTSIYMVWGQVTAYGDFDMIIGCITMGGDWKSPTGETTSNLMTQKQALTLMKQWANDYLYAL